MKAIKTKEMMKAYTDMNNARWWYEHDRKCETYRERYSDARSAFADATSALTEELNTIQRKCSARCVTAENIIEALCDICANLGISKASMNGIKAVVNLEAQHFARAYKYTPESTWFTATYKRGQWEITGIYRDVCTTSKGSLTLTEEAEKAIISRATRIQ